MVGYIPNKRQIIVTDTCGTGDGSGDGSIFLYDFVTQSWIKGSAATITDAVKSNFAVDWDGELIYHSGSTTYQWNDTPASSSISVKTKDIDFQNPGIKKNIYKLAISYKGDASAVTVKYATNGDTDTSANFNSTNTPLSNVGTDDWVLAELEPTSSVTNIYSIQIQLGGTAAADFEVNDMSIIYRTKGVR